MCLFKIYFDISERVREAINHRTYEKNLLLQEINADNLFYPSLPENAIKEPPPPAGFLMQCYLLYKRQLLCLKRDYTLLMARLFCHLLIGMIFGYLYMGSGYRANGVLANYVYMYGSLLLLVYTGKMAVTLACK